MGQAKTLPFPDFRLDRQLPLIENFYRYTSRSLPTTAPLQSHQTATEDARRAVFNWFTGKAGKWLFVFDGADQLHQRDQNFVDLPQYIPGCPNVHVIITSRSSTAGRLSIFEGVHVGELEEPQAFYLFIRCAEIPRMKEKTEAEVKAIVKELGCLALGNHDCGNVCGPDTEAVIQSASASR